MSFARRPLCYLLTIPALALGWMLGGPSESIAPPAGAGPQGKSPSPHAAAPPLPDFLKPGADGREPSFVETSLRILARAEHAKAGELARLKHELDDARYQTHPGYTLARDAVSRTYFRRASEEQLTALGPTHTRTTFFREWGARDLRSAFEAALRTPPPGQRVFNLGAALKNGADKDPELALQLVRGISDPRLRAGIAYDALTAVLRVDPGQFEALAREFPSHRSNIYILAIHQFAREDPAAALAQLEKVPPELRANARHALMESWSRSDYAAAFRWARENEVPVTEEVFRNWLAADPLPALESALKGGLAARNLFDDIAAILSSAKPAKRDEIVAWLAQLEDESLRARLTSGLFEGGGEPLPAVLDAARFAAEHPDGNMRDLRSLVNRIADPKARREFVLDLPPIVARTEMARHAGEWLRDDPQGFAAYVESMPTRRSREYFFNQAFGDGNYPHRDALQQFAERTGIRKPAVAP